MGGILHGIHLKCEKKSRNGYIGIIDALIFVYVRSLGGYQSLLEDERLK